MNNTVFRKTMKNVRNQEKIISNQNQITIQ